jgi:VanZ family protein
MWNLSVVQWRSLFRWSAVLLFFGILFATLFPFDFRPHNDVRVIEGVGVAFGRHAVIESDGPLVPQQTRDDAPCSIAILLKPASRRHTGTFLAFFSSLPGGQLQLQQDGAGLLIWHQAFRWSKHPSVRDIDPVFYSENPLTLLVLSSGPNGATVYTNGQLTKRLPMYALSHHAVQGRLVLGTDSSMPDSWRGEIRSLALYDQELSPVQIAEQYRAWTSGDEKVCESADGQTALFDFSKNSGEIIRNLCPGGASLRIPAHFHVPNKAFLELPWREFSPDLGYVADILRNILGFVPFGFALYGYLLLSGRTRSALLVTVLAGACTSFGIEVLQAFIPQRDSGLTDVMTNTFGMFCGALSLRFIVKRRALQNVPKFFEANT